MSKKVAVFDLDGTIGDFIAINYFSYLYDEHTIKYSHKEQYESYPDEVKQYLKDLEETFEKRLLNNGFTKIWLLRDNIDGIFDILKEKIKDKSLLGCMIYSNNGNLYNLEFAGRAIEGLMESDDIFIKAKKDNKPLNIYKGKKLFIDYTDKIRDTYDIPKTRARIKTVKTIQKAVKEYIDVNIEAEDILFLDDQIHEDILSHKDETTYIRVKQYEALLKKSELFYLYGIFQSTLLEMFKKHKTMKDTFFTLDHMKGYFPETLENVYISNTFPYIKRKIHDEENMEDYVEDNEITIRKINNFFNPIITGGKRKGKGKTIKKSKKYRNSRNSRNSTKYKSKLLIKL